MIRIIRVKDYEEMSRRAAAIITEQLAGKPDSVLGLATGTTPIGTYRELAEAYIRGEADFSRVTTVNLDEYVHLAPDHPQSYRYFMNHQLFEHVNIDPARTHVPHGNAEDLEDACRAYDALIDSLGGIDLQLLGIGHNGHIGFNEPGTCFIKDTHIVDLTERTIRANARLFADEDEVPRQALTMGVGPIMSAGHILLLVSGADKAPALEGALHGPITPALPASILQLHPDVTLVADEAALTKQ